MKRIVMFLTLIACAVSWRGAYAESDLGLKGIGGGIAIVSPENMDAAVGIGMMMDHGMIVPHLALESRLDFWSESQDVLGGEVKARDITLGARCKYLFDVSNPSIKPFAGAGLGMHFLHAEVTVAPPPGFSGPSLTVGDSSTKLGLDLGGGMAASLSPHTSLVAECWYGVVSNSSQLALRVGMLHRFGAQILESKSTPRHRVRDRASD